jgi:beta-galactosidase
MGVGGDTSWGAWTHPEYRLTQQTYAYAFRISLLAPGHDSPSLAKRTYKSMGR